VSDAVTDTATEDRMKSKRFQFCGAFQGTAKLRPGETMLAALDKHCKRMGINVGVDTDIKEVEE
jgi:hypothetical protein